MLETFGVSIGSEAVYRAMLQHPDQDLEGLALTLGSWRTAGRGWPTAAAPSLTSSRTT